MSGSVPTLESLLPHRRPMLLLHRLVDGDGESARAVLQVTPDTALVEPGRGFPAWALLEVFAQCAALIGGLRARQAGEAVAQGFLLGTRRLDCAFSHVPEGRDLVVEARHEFTDGAGMGAYRCRTLDEELAAECVLSVYIPPT